MELCEPMPPHFTGSWLHIPRTFSLSPCHPKLGPVQKGREHSAAGLPLLLSKSGRQTSLAAETETSKPLSFDPATTHGDQTAHVMTTYHRQRMSQALRVCPPPRRPSTAARRARPANVRRPSSGGSPDKRAGPGARPRCFH